MSENTPFKTERLNLRCSADAVSTLRDAAAVQNQDLTSFILGAALERARGVLTQDMFLRLTPAEVTQIEGALEQDGEVMPQLAALFRSNAAKNVAT